MGKHLGNVIQIPAFFGIEFGDPRMSNEFWANWERAFFSPIKAIPRPITHTPDVWSGIPEDNKAWRNISY